MALNDSLAPGLLEATQLTRAGHLLEATAAIQRALGRQPVAKPPQRPQTAKILEGRAGDFIAGSFSHPDGARPYKLYIPRGVIRCGGKSGRHDSAAPPGDDRPG